MLDQVYGSFCCLRAEAHVPAVHGGGGASVRGPAPADRAVCRQPRGSAGAGHSSDNTAAAILPPPPCRCTWACSAWAPWAASPSWAAPWPCCPRTRRTCTGRATWGRYTAACCSPPRPPRCSGPGCCSASATRRTPAPSHSCSALSTPQHSPPR